MNRQIASDATSSHVSDNVSGLNLTADVLVIGGGPSGTWAAWSAAKNGAKVILVDKGYCGTSGAAAVGKVRLRAQGDGRDRNCDCGQEPTPNLATAGI